jgi:hypothetical protein
MVPRLKTWSTVQKIYAAASFYLCNQSLHAFFGIFKAACAELVDKVSAVWACLASLSGKWAFSHAAFDPKPVTSLTTFSALIIKFFVTCAMVMKTLIFVCFECKFFLTVKALCGYVTPDQFTHVFDRYQ